MQEQLSQPGMTGMSFEERLALLVDREVHWRSDKRQARLLKAANLKYPQACIEDIDTRAGRGLERSAVMSLALGNWIESSHSVLITGLTGAGKTWLACALAQYACRRAHTALYQRVLRLGEELRIRHGNGSFGKWLLALAKTDVLLLDDWGMAGIDSQTRADLLEIIDDRAGNKATIITSQLPIEHWHAWIGDATVSVVRETTERMLHYLLQLMQVPFPLRLMDACVMDSQEVHFRSLLPCGPGALTFLIMALISEPISSVKSSPTS